MYDNSGSLKVIGDRAGNIAIQDPTGATVNSTAFFIQFSGSAVSSVTTATSGVIVNLVSGSGGSSGTGSSGGAFNKGALYNWPVFPRNTIVWRSEGTHTLGRIRALISGSTGATASCQAFRNSTNPHLSATLVANANNTWFDGGTVATSSYVLGDYLQFRLLGVSGTIEYAIIQADFTA